MSTDGLKSEKISFCATFKKHFKSFSCSGPSMIPSDGAAKWEFTANWFRDHYYKHETEIFVMTIKYIGKLSMQMSMAFHFTFTLPNGLVVHTTKDIKADFGSSETEFRKHFHLSDFPYDWLTVQVDIFPAYVQDGNEIPRKMLDLLNDPKYSDFVIAVQGTDIPVHKNILVNSSKVFEAMLVSGMSETETGRMEIDSFELKTVRAMVKFMYNGIVDRPSTPLVLDLLRASDMYAVDNLQEWCHQYLLQHFSSTNIMKILVAAHDFNIPKLKEKCLEFVTENRKEIDMNSAENKSILEERKEFALELLLKIWKYV